MLHTKNSIMDEIEAKVWASLLSPVDTTTWNGATCVAVLDPIWSEIYYKLKEELREIQDIRHGKLL